jgi:hypothetical protein
MTALNRFFYYSQYDEKYSHFRNMDMWYEVDYEGNEYPVFSIVE